MFCLNFRAVYGLIDENFRKVQSTQDWYLLAKREITEKAGGTKLDEPKLMYLGGTRIRKLSKQEFDKLKSLIIF